MSSDSSVNVALADYAAGRMTAQQLVGVVTAAYYREPGAVSRERLKPLIDIIERAHPGIVELSGNGEQPGFAVRLADRPFPKRYESELRETVSRVVTAPGSPLPAPEAAAKEPGLLQRIVAAIRRVFSASA